MREEFLKSLKEVDNFTLTENGAGALKSTGRYMLDAFGSLAAMKDSSEDQIIQTFMAAFHEDKSLAMRLLFYVRDIRGGQGMRRVFRVIVRYLANNYPDVISKNLDNFLFFGRGDDLLVLFGTPVEDAMVKYISDTLQEDMATKGYPSMLAKWLPSENASSAVSKKLARRLAYKLGVTPKLYRKMLSGLRTKIGVVEKLMSANEWDKIDFEKLPAKAAMIYSDAFEAHVKDNYIEYLNKLASGDAKINSASLFPVDIINRIMNNGYLYCIVEKSISLKDRIILDAMWKALPNYFENTEETGLCICDTSGSMSGTPLVVSLALGLYCADKCKGPFKDHFITFSESPKLQRIQGDNIVDKVKSIREINAANTNFEAALQLILDAAIKDNLSQSDLPSKLYVISDMQFDSAAGKRTYFNEVSKAYTPFMQTMKERFRDAGYTMPNIVYWNVRASNAGMFQETFEGENCCMVSGYSASLFKSIIDGTSYTEENVNGKTIVEQTINPVDVMNSALMNERYDRVSV